MDNAENQKTHYEDKLNQLVGPLAAVSLLLLATSGCKSPAATPSRSANSPPSPARKPRSACPRMKRTCWPWMKSTLLAGSGKKLELLTEDNQSKPGESATAVNKLIARDGVIAILARSPPAVRSKPRPSVSRTRFR